MQSCQYSQEITFQVSLNLLQPCFLVIYVKTIIRLQFTVRGYRRKKKLSWKNWHNFQKNVSKVSETQNDT